MQGLLKQNPQASMSGQASPQPQTTPQGQPPQQQPQPPQQGQGQGGGQQQMYETIVGQSEEYIYGEGLEDVKQQIQAGAGDGVEDDVGAVVGNLLAMNYMSAAEAGRTIPPKVMAGAAKELTEVVTDIAVNMQLITPEEADEAADEALYFAMSTFGERAGSNMPPEEQQQYAQLLQGLEQIELQAKGQAQPPQPGGQVV